MIIKRPGEAREPRARGLSAREKAVQAAIEKSQSRYLQLTCGHFQDLETTTVYAFDVLYQVLDRKIQMYCERCGDFSPAAPKRKIEDIPQTPLF